MIKRNISIIYLRGVAFSRFLLVIMATTETNISCSEVARILQPLQEICNSVFVGGGELPNDYGELEPAPQTTIKARYTWFAEDTTSAYASDGFLLNYLKTINPNGPLPINLALGRPVYGAPQYPADSTYVR